MNTLPTLEAFVLAFPVKSLPLGFLSTVGSHPLSSGDPGQLAPIVLPAWFVPGAHHYCRFTRVSSRSHGTRRLVNSAP